MPKRLATLSLLLAAASLMPGLVVKFAAQSADQGKGQGGSAPGAAAKVPPTIKKSVQSDTAGPKARPIAGEDKENSVKLTSLPPLTLADKHKTFWEYFYDWGQWVFALMLVVVGAMQVWLLIRQEKILHGAEREFRAQAKHMSRQTDLMNRNNVLARSSISVASQSVESMKIANRINLESLQAVQRPFVTFTYLDPKSAIRAVDPGDEENVEWRFYIPLENTGNTPAIQVYCHANWEDTDPDGLAEDFSYPNKGDAQTSPTMIAVNTRIYSRRLTIPIGLIMDVHQKRRRLFFYGSSTYRDMFMDTQTHVSEFCYEVTIMHLAGNEIAIECTNFGGHNRTT